MSIMDPLVVDEALSACLERDWEGGVDNDGLDISQLESYINDDNTDTMYFGDLQGGLADMKGLGSGTPRDSPSRFLHHHHHHHHHHANLQHHSAPSQLVMAQPHLSSSGSSTTTSMSGPPPPSSMDSRPRLSGPPPPSSMDSRARQSQATGARGTTPIGYYNPYHSYNSAYTGYRHHLPDSPPDSGSEPYSPLDHPNLSPHQKVGGIVDLYSSAPGGNMMAFSSYPVLQATQALPNPTSHNPMHGNNSLGYQQPIMLGGSHLSGSSVPAAGLGSTSTAVYGGPQSVVSQGPASGGAANAAASPAAPPGAAAVAAAKKRKMNDSGGMGPMVNIKQEPDQGVTSHLGPNVAVTSYSEEDEYTMDSTGGPFMDSSYQCIRFHNFQQHSWAALCDSALKELPLPTFRVDADKGFNFSNPDEAFVCQKKNHFQVTVHVQASGEPVFVKSPDGLQKVDRFYVHFFGVKTESPSQMIRVEQSQSDRSKKAFHPVPVDLKNDQMSKITVGRLHFSETTSNNMRKKGKPNPDQRYFYLVVALKAHCGDNAYPIAAHASEKIIVRASNPGQFESDVEYTFQRGTYPESIYHMGRVGINTDRPDEALVIHGNLKITGQLLQPSDKRAKKDVAEIDTKEQLKNVQNLRVVKYAYREEFADQAGMTGDDVYDTGVIAQEVKEVIPDAVKTTGDITLSNGEKIENFLLVNKERIFMENVGAVKELCKVTGNLENRIGELEIMNKKISQLRRFESFKSTSSSVSTRTSATSRVSSVCHRNRGCSKRHKHMGSAHDDGICSNKTLQVTTITLVCIMAFCLMAMATIYILDYQERRKELTMTTAMTTTATTIFLSSSMVTPTLRPASTERTSLSSDDGTLTSVVFTTKPTFGSTTQSPSIPKPPVIGKPEDCQETVPNEDPVCQVYCCPASNLWMGVITPVHPSPSTAATAITITRRIIHYGTTTVPATMSRYGEVITNKLSTSDPNTVNDSTTHSETPRFKPMPSKKSGTLDQMARLARHRAQLSRPSSSRSIKQTLSKRSIHSKRSTESTSSYYKSQMSTNAQIPTIDIVELNTTISHLYCLNSSDTYQDCFANTAKNYTYGLPISRFMPHTNLTLHFRFMEDDFARQPSFCANCSDSIPSFPFEQCSDTVNVLSPYEVVESNGESPRDHYVTLLNVGMWHQVAYKFRIPVGGGNEDPCNLTPEYIGEKYYELNFIFQRICTD
ncbi:myelin regulatory factor-like protein isoform X5 [Procambarus clarkii]|uniref:myelin regulatory factor-like protein isoform X5 n=1 Tax=Procambarus clarkii TaxID=6728 RepID=UPI001E673E42|nr:myelin regulatory factor-like protein isoform X2 [Procambarus clarkii]